MTTISPSIRSFSAVTSPTTSPRRKVVFSQVVSCSVLDTTYFGMVFIRSAKPSSWAPSARTARDLVGHAAQEDRLGLEDSSTLKRC